MANRMRPHRFAVAKIWWQKRRSRPVLRVACLPRDNSFRLSLFVNSASTGTGAPACVASAFRAAGMSAARALGNGG
jgi:hypothetical protein